MLGLRIWCFNEKKKLCHQQKSKEEREIEIKRTLLGGNLYVYVRTCWWNNDIKYAYGIFEYLGETQIEIKNGVCVCPGAQYTSIG